MRSMPSIRSRVGWVSALSAWGDGVIEVTSTPPRVQPQRLICKQTFGIVDPPETFGRVNGYGRAVFLSALAVVAALLTGATAPHPAPAQATLDDMTLAQRVGQLFMVGTTADRVDRTTKAQITAYHVGNVMLTGRSYDGRKKPAKVSKVMRHQVSQASTDGVRLFVVDRPGGRPVRVLQGPGFSNIPTALEQGTWQPRKLRGAAHVWAKQLRAAGVNLDLAPVMDTVPSKKAAKHNPPIGTYHREFGYTTRVVAKHGVAFLNGMADGGVATSAKHFPGLGRVRGNTDTAGHVTDHVTRRHDPYLAPFRSAIDARRARS